MPVETLKRGNLVLTHDGRRVPVDWLGIQTVSLRFAEKTRVLPIRIRAGALSENVLRVTSSSRRTTPSWSETP